MAAARGCRVVVGVTSLLIKLVRVGETRGVLLCYSKVPAWELQTSGLPGSPVARRQTRACFTVQKLDRGIVRFRLRLGGAQFVESMVATPSLLRRVTQARATLWVVLKLISISRFDDCSTTPLGPTLWRKQPRRRMRRSILASRASYSTVRPLSTGRPFRRITYRPRPGLLTPLTIR